MTPSNDHVLVLVAGPGARIAPVQAGAVRDALNAAGLRPGAIGWLCEDEACEIPLPDAAPDRVGDIPNLARRVLRGAPVDLAVVPVLGRRKRLLVADMDSTIVDSETLDELAAEAGVKARVAPITARAMNGEIDFKAALRERVALLADLPVTALERTFAKVRLNPGAATLVATMRANGAHALLVSGGFRFFTSRVAAMAGFHGDRSNEFEIAGDRLTGRVVEPILDKEAKVEALLQASAHLGVGTEAAVTVGDGANDLPMLLRAGLGVAWRAKPAVAASAPVRIDHADLTALLYLQGYRRAEFVLSAPDAA
ncbi:MAG: phosphoserine phosphatase SerB [Alphaproteobacteria bacterium]